MRNDLFQDFINLKKAMVFNFDWFIHASPEENIDSIKSQGLRPFRDAPIPPDLQGMVSGDPILCLHPLAAKECPSGVCNTLEEARDNVKLVTLAVPAIHLPPRVNIDWSNAWPIVRGRIEDRANMDTQELMRYLATEFGSVVVYDGIDLSVLRVFCAGSRPANPMTWPALLSAPDAAIIRHN